MCVNSLYLMLVVNLLSVWLVVLECLSEPGARGVVQGVQPQVVGGPPSGRLPLFYQRDLQEAAGTCHQHDRCKCESVVNVSVFHENIPSKSLNNA